MEHCHLSLIPHATCPSYPMPPVPLAHMPPVLQYDAFLSKNGGSSNAFTETECTTYHFEVEHEFLKPALDRCGVTVIPSPLLGYFQVTVGFLHFRHWSADLRSSSSLPSPKQRQWIVSCKLWTRVRHTNNSYVNTSLMVTFRGNIYTDMWYVMDSGGGVGWGFRVQAGASE